MRRASGWVTCIRVAAIFLARPLHAQPSPDAGVDAAVPTGAVLAGLGSTALIVGGVLYATGDAEPCGVGGCSATTQRRGFGTLLLGAGAGLAVAGIPALLGGLLAPASSEAQHLSDERMVAGLVLLGLSAAIMSMSTAVTVAADRSHVGDAGIATFPAFWAGGSVLFTVGLPILVSGAPLRRQEQLQPPPYSRAMANAGYALMAIGGTLASGSSVYLAYVTESKAGLGPFMTAATLTGVGHTIVFTGLPLALVGRSRREGPSDAVVPSLRLGAGTAEAVWTFN